METENLVSPIPNQSQFKGALVPALAILLIIVAGGLTGRFLANRGLSSGGGVEVVQIGKEVGIKDEKTFRDTASGRLEVDASNSGAEGSHKLIRPGGLSQTAYLISSVIDLDQFVGKCVQVWGETFAAQKAGWLMDVGRAKILDSCPEGL
ncbi:hypothetical protein COT65_01180 [Candidatus Shapirobacteria bacterium CG09_land_8_20_14_0_10_47_13]|uniref:Uncharacterized protein n=1 Tax=Candidatus Shapirobacteria bacterium CG09_land_8_20_14_0_10_47_13 TaxID=1974481 RepID=A0A2H0WMY0_9BACT|nr:MAG: hypothetical protein COT65_01180 [Candidatus Shapirobacteria bacterium CG09_land_8_20_14_0_10_47_13]